MDNNYKLLLNSIHGQFKGYTDTDISMMRYAKCEELLATFILKDDLQWRMVNKGMGLEDIKELSKLNDKIATLRKELQI
jgi:hypothetical protein